MEKVNIGKAAFPEEVGVSSKEIQAFIDHCIELNKELHSIMVLRHGKVACEVYREPYGPEHKHMMYSVSKSVTATAIGFAIDEGYISLDTKFLDIFPEARREPKDENLEKLCVEDLLTMRSGLSVTPFMDKTQDSWFDAVINSNWVSEPGTEFLYISENMYLLCHIIHKVCGCSVIDFLQPRLFDPLGIKNVFWETDNCGVEAGGWGIMLSTQDLAKFTLTYQQNGKFDGKQIIPEWFVKEAVKKHTETVPSKTDLDTVEGYGYCFWRCGGYKDAYRSDGMFTQLGICFEDLDACLIITAGEINEQLMRDVIWDHFPKAFIDDCENADTIGISIPPYKKLEKNPRSSLEKKINNKTIRLSKPTILNAAGFPTSVLTFPTVYMQADKAGNIDNVSFFFTEAEMQMTWNEGDEVNSISVGMDGEYRWDEITLGGINYHTAAVATWTNENELKIQIRAIETTCERYLTFIFEGKKVTMIPDLNPSIDIMVDWVKDSIKSIVRPESLANVASKTLPVIGNFVNAKQTGKIN